MKPLLALFSMVLLAIPAAHARALYVDKESVQFPNARVGDQVDDVVLTFTNTGPDLRIDALALECADADLVPCPYSVTWSIKPGKATIASLETFTATVRFRPLNAVSEAGTLSIWVLPSGGLETLTVPLTGQGIAANGSPMAAAEAILRSDGGTPLHSSEGINLDIRNLGDSPLFVQSISIDNPAFTLAPSTKLVAIAPGGSSPFNILFSPKALGPARGYVTVVGGENGIWTLTLPVEGTGLKEQPVFGLPPHGSCATGPRRSTENAAQITLLLTAILLAGLRRQRRAVG